MYVYKIQAMQDFIQIDFSKYLFRSNVLINSLYVLNLSLKQKGHLFLTILSSEFN